MFECLQLSGDDWEVRDGLCGLKSPCQSWVALFLPHAVNQDVSTQLLLWSPASLLLFHSVSSNPLLYKL